MGCMPQSIVIVMLGLSAGGREGKSFSFLLFSLVISLFVGCGIDEDSSDDMDDV